MTPHGALDHPHRVEGLSDATQLSMGTLFSCALTAAGQVKCWGEGVMGEASRHSGRVVTIAGVEGATHVAVGGDHGCAVTREREVACWGRTHSHRWSFPGASAVTIDGVRGVTRVAASLHDTCVLSVGRVICWGLHRERPSPLTAAPSARDIAMLDNGVCVVGEDERVHCWGRGCNLHTTRWGNPCERADTEGATALAAGEDAMCVHASGQWRCWGNNALGQLDRSAVSVRHQPTPLSTPSFASKAQGVALGERHGCAIDADGDVQCWGTPFYGELGRGPALWLLRRYELGFSVASLDHLHLSSLGMVALVEGVPEGWGTIKLSGATEPFSGPVGAPMSPIGGVSRVSVVGADGCAAGATTWCWGVTLPNGPRHHDALRDVTALSTSGGLTCAVAGAERQLFCWGRNWRGPSSAVDIVTATEPRAVPGAAGITSVATGDSHVCYVDDGALLRCVGANFQGQLGVPGANQRTQPVEVLTGVERVAATRFGTCALRSGEVWCWGEGGTHGRGHWRREELPQKVALPASVRAIDGAERHFIAVTTAGELWAWGRNGHGELGLGDQLGRARPTKVPELSGVLAARAGQSATCVRRSGGNVLCWGLAAARLSGEELAPRVAPAPALRLGQVPSRALETVRLTELVPRSAP